MAYDNTKSNFFLTLITPSIYRVMFKLISDLFFPLLCQACEKVLGDNEIVICTTCRHHLPIVPARIKASDLQIEFLEGVQIKTFFALFYFKKSSLVQKLLHNLKYNNQEIIGTVLGEWLGAQLKGHSSYQYVDKVLPVPLHSKRLRQRGYNQVMAFAKAIALALNYSCDETVLKKVQNTKTQVFQSKSDRWKSVQHSFELTNPEVVFRKNILLVDDIITTGATLNACAKVLLEARPKSISVVCIAIPATVFR